MLAQNGQQLNQILTEEELNTSKDNISQGVITDSSGMFDASTKVTWNEELKLQKANTVYIKDDVS